MRLLSLHLTVFFLLALCSAKATYVSYPALGNIDLNEGTIEVWLTPMAPMTADDEDAKWKRLFDFMEISSPGGFTCGVTFSQNKDRPRFRVRFAEPGGGMQPLSFEKQGESTWEPGKPARIALVWKNRWMAFYVDGKLLGEKTQNASMQGSLNELIIRLGAPKGPVRPWLLQGVRISSVARTPDQLPEQPPEADAYTLLLDVATDWKQTDKQTTTRVIALIDGQPQGGVIEEPGKATAKQPGIVID